MQRALGVAVYVAMTAGVLLRPAMGLAAAPVFGAAAPVNGNAATDPGQDGTPRIISDGQGTWLTIWASTNATGGNLGSDSDVLVARSGDLGISWSGPVPVNLTAPVDAAFDFAPALATDGHGNWVAVWVATNGLDTDIFVARSTNAGTSWSAATSLYADAGTDSGNDDRPQIMTDGVGTWVVVWDSSGRLGNDRDVFVSRSLDGGVTWSAPAAVGSNAGTDRGADQRAHLATDGAGAWVVAWASTDTLGGTIGNDFDLLVARSTDGGVTWTAPMALNGNAAWDQGLDDRPQLATDRQGTWVAVWVSDDPLGGTLGSDLDVLTARSTDGGLTWSAPAALNGNAASDSGEDGAPAVATDGSGTWVAVWESNDTRGGTLGSDPDILMAHSLDGGANWSAPRALDPDATSDTRRDIAPQIATNGGGVWNAVWAGSGGSLGADTDILRSGGRERCGNGAVDPGEQCDDGNTNGGDACPASCEFPPPPTPVATPTAHVGGTTSTGGATPTSGGSPTPSGQGGGATPSGPGSSATASPTMVGTPDPNATLTPTGIASTAESTPTSGGSPPSPTPTLTSGNQGTTPSPVSTASGFGGSLANKTTAKAAVGCQRALVKAGAQLVGARLAGLSSCGRAVQRCIQTKPDDPVCLQKAAGRCQSAAGALSAADSRQGAAVRKRCGGLLALGDVLDPAGLGYGQSPCGASIQPDSLEDLVDCVVGEHACRGAAFFELVQPRIKELMRLPGVSALTLDTLVCLPDHGGDGAAVGDPHGQGKAVDACASAIMKAGTSFVRKRLARLSRCVNDIFSCVQLAPNDSACLTKARTRCDHGSATSAAEERKLEKATGKRCGVDVVAYATLRAAQAANLDALADQCAAVGVSELESLADYQQCLRRAGTCRAEEILRAQVPRVGELLNVVGRSFGSEACGGR